MAQSNTESRFDPSSGRSNDAARWRADDRDAQQGHRERTGRDSEEERDPALGEARASAAELRDDRALDSGDPDQLWQRWWQIQANFVDAPRSAVAEAHALVSGIVDGLVRQLEAQRAELEQRWSSGQEISTEELRCDMQRYRDFLGRLLSRLQETNT